MGWVKKRNHMCPQNAYAHCTRYHFKNKGLGLNASFPTLTVHFLATYKWTLGRLEMIWWPLHCYRT